MDAAALAALIATHPYLSFAAVAALGLALAGGAWRLLLRLRRAGIATLQKQLLACTLVLLCIAAFLWLAHHIGLDSRLARFDRTLADALRQHVQAQTLRRMAAVTHLGDVLTLTVLCVAVTLALWQRRLYALSLCWIAAVAGNGIWIRLLKAAFERTRPLHEHGWALEQGWSFPSGHASGAMATYGMLAYVLLRLQPRAWQVPVLVVAVILILVTGYSRIVLQVHYFSDVLAAYASASAWLVLCIIAAERLRAVPAAGADRAPAQPM